MSGGKSGSRGDVFRREGKDWYINNNLPSDVTIKVDEIYFHLHKFPLLSKSGCLENIFTNESKEETVSVIDLSDIPAGSKAFELVVRFCYGAKCELTASNVVYLRCAADFLQMTEDVAEENLIFRTENFLNNVVLRSWKHSIKALQACADVFPDAQRLQIVRRCVDSIATKSYSDPIQFGWPITESSGRPTQSPGGSVMWNGISSGAKPRNFSSDWWYDDVSSLSLPLYKELIISMESHGISRDIIVGSLGYYAKKHLPGLKRRQSIGNHSGLFSSSGVAAIPSEDEQKYLLEELDRLLPFEKGSASSKMLFGLLRTAFILKASDSCISNLEKRIGMQLEKATLEDLLIPNLSDSVETLYDVDCIQRILDHFLAMEQEMAGASPVVIEEPTLSGSASMPITVVAKLIDGYLAEIASDKNLKPSKFCLLAGAIPEYARPMDDGLYRAIDIYLKAHPELTEYEREEMCRLMDCQKLSLEACTHAAQNERLPLRAVVQVLFFEQLQLRNSVAECFLMSDNISGSQPIIGAASAVREDRAIKAGMDDMRARVADLEKECLELKATIERLSQRSRGSSEGSSRRNSIAWKLRRVARPQICSAKDAHVDNVMQLAGEDSSVSQRGVARHLSTLAPDA